VGSQGDVRARDVCFCLGVARAGRARDFMRNPSRRAPFVSLTYENPTSSARFLRPSCISSLLIVARSAGLVAYLRHRPLLFLCAGQQVGNVSYRCVTPASEWVLSAPGEFRATVDKRCIGKRAERWGGGACAREGNLSSGGQRARN